LRARSGSRRSNRRVCASGHSERRICKGRFAHTPCLEAYILQPTHSSGGTRWFELGGTCVESDHLARRDHLRQVKGNGPYATASVEHPHAWAKMWRQKRNPLRHTPCLPLLNLRLMTRDRIALGACRSLRRLLRRFITHVRASWPAN
jgi:hypothetical protein